MITETEKITKCCVIFFKENADIKESQILLVKHPQHLTKDGMMNTWDLPKGGREKGETCEECARRELYEETGIVVDNFDDFEKWKKEKKMFYLKRVDDTFVLNHQNFNIQDTKEVEEVSWIAFKNINLIVTNKLVKYVLYQLTKINIELIQPYCKLNEQLLTLGIIMIKGFCAPSLQDDCEILLVNNTIPTINSIVEMPCCVRNLFPLVLENLQNQTELVIKEVSKIKKQIFTLFNNCHFFVVLVSKKYNFKESKTIKELEMSCDNKFLKKFLEKFKDKIHPISSKYLL